MKAILQTDLRNIRRLFLLVCLAFLSMGAFAQVKFSVVCPNKKIGKDDVLQIQFKVENATSVDNINPPPFNNFQIVSGPNQERSQSNINGRISSYVAIGFTLRPVSTGSFTIASATAVADGQTLKTSPVTIQVVKGSIAPAQPSSGGQNTFPFPNLNFDVTPPSATTRQFDDYILKPGDNVAEKTAKNIFIKLDVDKTSCFVGSPITATYKLYTRLPSETNITNAPSFDGFSVNDLQVSSNASLEKYNGRMYNVFVIRKVELYPLQAGDFTLDPVVANNKVTFVKSQYLQQQTGDLFDIFQNFGSSAIPPEGQVIKNVTLQSAPVVIHVKPLPVENKPADFRGAVGDFTITATLPKNNFTTDDAGTLKITITGKGNIQLVNAPAIHWPQGIDGFDAKVSDDIDKTKVPMEGSKIFSYPFTAAHAGEYKIDSISFSFFDPQAQTYKTIYTLPVSVAVTKGKGIATGPFVDTDKADSNPFLSSKAEWIAGIVLLALILIVLLFYFIRKNKNEGELETGVRLDDLKNEVEEKQEPAEFPIPANPLAAAHEKMSEGNSRDFYQTLDLSLKKYLAEKFDVPLTEISRKRVSEELDKYNVSLGTSLMVSSLINDIELNLYTPASNIVEINNVFEKASEVVSLLDKQIVRKK